MNIIINETQIILDVTHEFLNRTGISQSDFALKMLAPKMGEIEPLDPIEWKLWKGRQIKLVSRYLVKEREFPLSLKWIWINALPSEFGELCKHRLFAAAGQTMPLPSLEGADSVDSSVAELLGSTAEVAKRLEPAYDGKYDSSDSLDVSNRLIDALLKSAQIHHAEAKKVHYGTGATGYEYDIKGFKF